MAALFVRLAASIRGNIVKRLTGYRKSAIGRDEPRKDGARATNWNGPPACLGSSTASQRIADNTINRRDSAPSPRRQRNDYERSRYQWTVYPS